ncbi:DNA-methyltransferase [Streptomyces lonarensis]|uniref:Methyltransferase n=1 Tax=Streptomyces lonarensis TaxID=700599 RepID=A0A7X6CX75_9ACTN|nr:site-specific DNA-methyltransferase [Streptomyces lonarensis]NJQ04251.1 site-specific DNA-methyltransferase [Streptomyces lonarensis]
MTAPYYADDQVALYLGDCREVLPALGLTADLVLTDPPYGDTALAWDRWPVGWVAAVTPLARSMWCFGSMRMWLTRAGELEAAGWQMSHDVVWEKHNGSGFAADRFRRVHEHALHWYRGPWREVHREVPRLPAQYSAKGRTVSQRQSRTPHAGEIGAATYIDDGLRLARSVLPARSMHRAAIHPTEKPVTGLLEHLIAYGCPVGGTVLDVFAGSGSTLDAARQSGRRAIGIEADERYAEAAARRLSAAPLPLDAA